jgi:hypothetical protein
MEIFTPDNASDTGKPAALTERVSLAVESGDLDAIRDLLDPGAHWGVCLTLAQHVTFKHQRPRALAATQWIHAVPLNVCRAD